MDIKDYLNKAVSMSKRIADKISGKEYAREAARKGRENTILRIAKERGLKGDRLLQFMAQVKKETGGFKKFEEDAHFSINAMRANFAKARELEDGTIVKPPEVKNYSSSDFKLTDEELENISPKYKGTKKKFFNTFYSNRSDLGTGPNEGHLYYGRGPIQITGKANYKTYNVDADKMTDLEYATNKSLDYFLDITKNIPEESKDTDAYTKKINEYTRPESYKERKSYYNKYREKYDQEAKSLKAKDFINLPERLPENVEEVDINYNNQFLQAIRNRIKNES